MKGNRSTYNLFFAVIFIAVSFCGCGLHNKGFDSVLEKLMNHYQEEDVDSLKVEAVKFIAENIKWHYTVTADSAISDTESLDYDFLREHIDYIFNVWRTSPYSKDIDFESFKEYILPYTSCTGIGPNITAKERGEWMVGHGIIPGKMTVDEIVARYNNLIDSLRNIKSGLNRAHRLGLEDLNDEYFTDCTDKAHHCILNLRSIGIPCIAERNWCYRKLMGHHVHCAVFKPEENKFYRFNAEDLESVPDSGGWNFVEMQNICRLTYSRQHSSPFFLKQSGEKTLYPFTSPCIKDVTRKSYSASINIKTDSLHNIVYLATFSPERGGLMPVTWGLVDSTHTSAKFNDVLPSTLYFAGISDSGAFKVSGTPFYFDIKGDSLSEIPAEFAFLPRKRELVNVMLKRKYPVKEKTMDILESLRGTIIEASDNVDFKTREILAILTNPLNPEIQEIRLKNTKSYKYYRLLTPGNAPAKISILRWKEEDGSVHEGSSDSPAYDGDMTTAKTDTNEIGIVFRTPVCIKSIEIAPLNADNGVTPGHRYQLNYYGTESGKWKQIGVKTAESREIVFDNVPARSLLWLVDLSKGREEMPFLIRDGKQYFLYPDLIAPIP